MRIAFVAFMIVALMASTMTAASAFNFASLSARSLGAAVVTDNGSAYLSIAPQDANYQCYVSYGSDGKVTFTLNGGTSCVGATGTGVNPGSTYIFTDVLKITNKGTKDLTGLWLNVTDTTGTVKIQTATSSGSMTAPSDGSGYALTKSTTSLTVGSSYYVGFLVDSGSVALGSSAVAATMTIEARSSN